MLLLRFFLFFGTFKVDGVDVWPHIFDQGCVNDAAAAAAPAKLRAPLPCLLPAQNNLACAASPSIAPSPPPSPAAHLPFCGPDAGAFLAFYLLRCTVGRRGGGGCIVESAMT